MSGNSFAKEEVMQEYLDALLTDVQPEDTVRKDAVAKLLEKAAPEETLVPVVDQPELKTPQVETTSVDKQEKPADPVEVVQEEYVQTEEFQALFFEVAGLTLAVPLTELGGIHQIDKVGPLFGKPDWFKGVMLHREEKLSVVDTAKWVMPEKYDEKLAESLNYQYLIMLDESNWGLACESLVTTASLQPDEVKWREAHGKRPWLAGMVKKKMCALVNVAELITLLDKGLGSNEI